MTREQAMKIKAKVEEIAGKQFNGVEDYRFYEKQSKMIITCFGYQDNYEPDNLNELVEEVKSIANEIQKTFNVSAEAKKLRYQGFINIWNLVIKA